MKSLLWPVCFLFSTALFAQEFKKELEGKMVPAKMIFGDGKVQEVELKYQAPEFFANPSNKFTIKPTFQSEPYTHSGGIEAFMVDGNIWAMRAVGYTGQFCVLRSQGAIEQYTYIKNVREAGKDTENFVILGDRFGTIHHKVGSSNDYVEGELTMKQLRKWISDAPEIVTQLDAAEASAKAEQEKQAAESASAQPAQKKKGLMGAVGKLTEINDKQIKAERATIDLGRIINNYNAWYEANNPGKIKYYFIDAPASIKAPKKELTTAERKDAAAAKLEDQYAGRSSTPSAEIASAKENQPVKKETFAAKMQRIKADGNKIGVIFYLKPAAVPKSDANSSSGPSKMMNQMMPSNEVAVEGKYLDKSLLSVGEEFKNELNIALGTTDIELIDINDIPYKDLKLGRVDDWWATKYKVVFAYTVDPRVTLSKRDSKSVASVNMITSLQVMEYIGSSDSPKQKVVAQVLNMGSFVTPEYVQEEDMTSIEEIYKSAIGMLNMPIHQKIKSERVDPLAKLVEKKLR